jgi:predicted phage terminase large subunit-like protein
MVEFVWEGLTARQHTQILCPRGAAKTTWLNTILGTWLISKYDLRVGLVSNTDMQSQDFSRAMKWTFESNGVHRELFGDLVNPSKWTNKEWIKRDSKFSGTKDVSLFAVGVGGAIISKRFDVLLMDDILDEENTSSPETRANTKNWFLKTLKPCLAPDGVIISIGTRWAESDLYEDFITPVGKGGQGWRHLLISALTDDQQGHLASYWPEVWSVERLLEEKASMGSALFACAYQNDISGLLEGNVFKGPFDHFDVLPEGHKYLGRMGVDLASSTKETADYTARVTTFEDICPCDLKGHFYVMSAYRDRRESHHAEFIADGYAAYPNIEAVMVETNQFQSTLVQEVMQDYPQIPIIGKKSDTDKMTRARALAAKYEAHRVHHHESLRGTALETELLSFPKGHDDLIDSLGFSCDLSGNSFFFGSLRR